MVIGHRDNSCHLPPHNLTTWLAPPSHQIRISPEKSEFDANLMGIGCRVGILAKPIGSDTLSQVAQRNLTQPQRNRRPTARDMVTAAKPFRIYVAKIACIL